MKKKWTYKKIGDVCIVERGGSPRPIDSFITDSSDGINWIKIGDTDDSMFITQTEQKIKPEGMKKSRYVQSGDFLLSNSMSFGRPYILKIDGCIHDGWLVLRDNDNLFDKRFLYYYLSSPTTYRKFQKLAVGGVVNNLNSSMVSEVLIPVIPKSEQNDLANRFDLVKNIISKRKEQLAQLDNLIKSRFVELFGDPEKNTKKWEENKLSNYLNVVGGYAFKSEGFEEEGIPVLRIGNINSGAFKDTNLVYWKYDESLDRYAIYPGDLVMSLTGTVGKDDYGNVCFLGNEYKVYYLNQRNVKLELFDGLNKYYLANILRFPEVKSRLTGISRGVRQANISNKDILSLQLPIPPIDLQKQFATFVQQVDKLKVEVQKSLNETQLFFDSLMQKYFE